VEVTLWNCGNCEELPPLGKLQHLKRLEVDGMKYVKWIDGESDDGVEPKAFPSLEKLRHDFSKKIRDLEVWRVEVTNIQRLIYYFFIVLKLLFFHCVKKIRMRVDYLFIYIILL